MKELPIKIALSVDFKQESQAGSNAYIGVIVSFSKTVLKTAKKLIISPAKLKPGYAIGAKIYTYILK